MKTIAKESAQKYCSYWHNGQWSQLYSYASTGIFIPENIKLYLNEIQQCIEVEYNLIPTTLTKKDALQLNRLKRYFKHLALKQCITIVEYKHTIYGNVLFSAPFNNLNINIVEPKYQM